MEHISLAELVDLLDKGLQAKRTADSMKQDCGKNIHYCRQLNKVIVKGRDAELELRRRGCISESFTSSF